MKTPSSPPDLSGALQRFVRWFAGAQDAGDGPVAGAQDASNGAAAPSPTPEEHKRRRVFNTVVGVLVVLGGIGLIFQGEDLFFALVGVLLVLVAAGMVLVTWRSG